MKTLQLLVFNPVANLFQSCQKIFYLLEKKKSHPLTDAIRFVYKLFKLLIYEACDVCIYSLRYILFNAKETKTNKTIIENIQKYHFTSTFQNKIRSRVTIIKQNEF